MSFQKVVKQDIELKSLRICFRTVSFQKVVKLFQIAGAGAQGFRTVSFQKVVKQKDLMPHK